MYIKYYHYLKSYLRKLDRYAIILILYFAFFQYAVVTQRWIVVCVPFTSSSEDLLSLNEDFSKILIQNHFVDRYMCLHYGFTFVQFTAPYTDPAFASLDSIKPEIFSYLNLIFRIINLILLPLLVYGIFSAVISNLSATIKRRRFQIIFAGSVLTGVLLAASLTMLCIYKEKIDFYPHDTVKKMLIRFTSAYGVSFYVSWMALVVDLFLIMTLSLFHFKSIKSKRKNSTATV